MMLHPENPGPLMMLRKATVFSSHHRSPTRFRDQTAEMRVAIISGASEFGFSIDVLPRRRPNAEIAMKTQPDRDTIAEEAIGQRHGSAPDYAPTKEAALQLAPSSGAQASIPEKTAESVG